MTVGAGAGTAGARLDAEQVVEQHGQQLVMQVFAARVPNIERDDADPAFRVRIAENLDIVVLPPAPERAPGVLELAFVNHVGANGVLDLEHEPRLECL